MTTYKLFCFGHRGACGHEPENTIRSVRKALALGADGVEVDVYFVDGQLVVIHDDTLERTTNGRGRVAGKTFACLRSLDAGLGEKIPTLAEIFYAVNRRGWSFDDFLVSSFDHAQLREAKQLCPEIRIGALIEKVPRGLAQFAEDLGAWSLHASKRCVTPKLVEDTHQRGLKIFVFTVNSPKDIALMQALGVDGVFSDYPERICH